MKAITAGAMLLMFVMIAGGGRESADVIGAHRKGVAGSVHDFSGPQGGHMDACRACHVPHLQGVKVVATTRPAGAPTTQPSYEVYRISDQRRVFLPDRYTPGPASLICLGCHDGTIATSTIGSSHAMLAGVREGFKMPDGFVWRDHPIGIRYPDNRREYRPQAFVQAKGIRMPEGRIECVSCHDPHNESGHPAMLAASNRRSALCLTCHIK